jgi:NAD(P)-dependent dehydrogenase (short-subunit alcohol dehydrogenase family)
LKTDWKSLVNVAGGFAWETVMDGNISTWDRMWAMNVQTALNACRSTIPFLEGGHSSIVNIGSAAAARAEFGKAAYAAAKSGVARLTESLAEELKSKEIRLLSDKASGITGALIPVTGRV